MASAAGSDVSSARTSVPAAGTNRSGARSRTSRNSVATRVMVWESAPNSSASRPTRARGPTPDPEPAADAGSPPSASLSEEEFGGIDWDTALLQRAFDAVRRFRIHLRLTRQIEDQLRPFHYPFRIEHHHDARLKPPHQVLRDHDADLARIHL